MTGGLCHCGADPCGDTFLRYLQQVVPLEFFQKLLASTELLEKARLAYDGKTERGDRAVLHLGMHFCFHPC